MSPRLGQRVREIAHLVSKATAWRRRDICETDRAWLGGIAESSHRAGSSEAARVLVRSDGTRRTVTDVFFGIMKASSVYSGRGRQAGDSISLLIAAEVNSLLTLRVPAADWDAHLGSTERC